MPKITSYQRLTIKLKSGELAHFMGPAYEWPDDAEIEAFHIGDPITLPDGLFMIQDDDGHFQLMIDKSALACQE